MKDLCSSVCAGAIWFCVCLAAMVIAAIISVVLVVVTLPFLLVAGIGFVFLWSVRRFIRRFT